VKRRSESQDRTPAAIETGGFTLVETMFALAIMTTGLLSLAGVFSYGMLSLNRGDELLIAKEKATEGIESVFLARDTLTRTWDQVHNQAAGGIFLNGAHALDGYSREIEITDLNPNLRQIRVIVKYPYGDSQREYELLTYISAFS
jgi:type II secretory pathway pseudopilin PulG